MKPARAFHVVLRPEPRGVDALGRTPATRLRALLKAALRRYGLRCG